MAQPDLNSGRVGLAHWIGPILSPLDMTCTLRSKKQIYAMVNIIKIYKDSRNLHKVGLENLAIVT